LSKTVHRTAFSLWSEFPTLPFVRFYVKQNQHGFAGNVLREMFCGKFIGQSELEQSLP
jgi:hypothetical protein